MWSRPTQRAVFGSIATVLFGVPLVLAQTTAETSFRVRDDQSDSLIDCAFVVRDGLSSDESSMQLLARPPRRPMTVSRLSTITYTNAQADGIFNAASSLIEASQSNADASCCYELRRSGAVGTFTAPSGMVGGVITNSSESSAVFAVNAAVKIVSGISFCGQSGSYVGCADGSTLIFTASTGGATLAHEVGHLQGLCHTSTSCNPTCGQCGTCTCSDASAFDVMFCAICNGASQGIISSSECSSYRDGATP